MLIFGTQTELDPSAGLLLGGNEGTLSAERYFSRFPVNWKAQSNAHSLLLNGSGLLIYGGFRLEYWLDSYAKTYGGFRIEYILGGIVEGSFESVMDVPSAHSTLAEYVNLSFSSTADIPSALSVSREVDVSFASVCDGSSALVANLTLDAVFSSTLEILTHAVLDGIEYDVWAFTLDSEHTPASRYENFNFNSFAKLSTGAGDLYYAADDTGIFELTGGTDNGTQIQASLLTGRHAEGSEHLQQVLTGYLAGTSTGQLVLRVITDSGAIHSYTAEAALGTNPTRQRVKLGKGLKSNFWQFEIKNQSGEDFNLMNVDVLPVVLKRRIK
jgi:hypothetical protein